MRWPHKSKPAESLKTYIMGHTHTHTHTLGYSLARVASCILQLMQNHASLCWGFRLSPLPLHLQNACRYAGLIRPSISRGIALFVGQPAMLTGLPARFFLLKSNSLLSEGHTHSYSPLESSVLKANRGHHDGSQVNAAAPS